VTGTGTRQQDRKGMGDRNRYWGQEQVWETETGTGEVRGCELKGI